MRRKGGAGSDVRVLTHCVGLECGEDCCSHSSLLAPHCIGKHDRHFLLLLPQVGEPNMSCHEPMRELGNG